MTNEISENRNGFAELGISGALLAALQAGGMTEPKPIQAEAIPHFLEGRDILGLAQTGSGKTAAFSLPILQKIIAERSRNKPRSAKALVLVPTRELAVQVETVVRQLSKGSRIFTAVVLGGVSRGGQIRRMAQGVDVLIATPGRLMDLIQDRAIDLSETRYLVLDEADRMLDMGFINDVRRIASMTNRERQTTLFSATMPKEIESLADSLLKDPIQVKVAQTGTTASEIKQSVIIARTNQKREILTNMLGQDGFKQIIVFARTKHGADRVTRDLEHDGIRTSVIHGNKSQNARQRALNDFRNGIVRVLVATDIAARGIDVPGVSHVINFDLPDEAESYVHRIGRTGRNGAEGEAITLCDPGEMNKLRQVERLIRNRIFVAHDHTGGAGRHSDDQKNRRQSRPKRAFGNAPGGRSAHSNGKHADGAGDKNGRSDNRPRKPRKFGPVKKKSFGSAAA